MGALGAKFKFPGARAQLGVNSSTQRSISSVASARPCQGDAGRRAGRKHGISKRNFSALHAEARPAGAECHHLGGGVSTEDLGRTRLFHRDAPVAQTVEIQALHATAHHNLFRRGGYGGAPGVDGARDGCDGRIACVREDLESHGGGAFEGHANRRDNILFVRHTCCEKDKGSG